MLKLILCEFLKLKRKRFVWLVIAASFLFPIPLTVIVYYYNAALGKYETSAAAFDALWQSVIGFGMLMLLPCILGILAAILFFMERDNDTFKNLRTIPVTSAQTVISKCIVLLLFSVLFCLSSTAASLLCGSFFFEVTGIFYKLGFSAAEGILIFLGALPLVLLIVFFNKSFLFSILLCVFYSMFNLLFTFAMPWMPKALVFLMPTPSLMLWGAAQTAAHVIANDAKDLQMFIENGLIPSTLQLLLTLGAIGTVSLFGAIYYYQKRGD